VVEHLGWSTVIDNPGMDYAVTFNKNCQTHQKKSKKHETDHKSKKCDAPLLWKSKHLEGDSDMVSA